MTTILRRRENPAGYDNDGDPVAGTVAYAELGGAFLAPRDAAVAAASEVLDTGRQGVVVGLTLYAPANTDLVHTDQIVVADATPLRDEAGDWLLNEQGFPLFAEGVENGVLYDIDGEVALWEHPMTGWRPGIVAALRRAAG